MTDKAQHDGATSAAPYTARRIEEMDAGFSGHFVRARAELGVQSFGISILLLSPDFEGYAEHDHGRDHCLVCHDSCTVGPGALLCLRCRSCGLAT